MVNAVVKNPALEGFDAFQLNHSKTLLDITRVGGHHSQNEMEISLAVGKFVYS